MSDPRHANVLILANPRAGSETSRRVIGALMRGLKQAGLGATLCWDRDELSRRVTEERDDLRCVVAAGGDGTVLEVINRAPGVPVAVLPLGTENLVARHCGLTRCGQTLANVIAAGRMRRLDLARAGGRVFCLMAGAGFDAAVVHDVHRRRRGHISRLSYAVPILQEMQRYRFPMIEIEVVDTGERLRGAMAFLFNVPLYGLGLPIAPDARPDDGLLDLYLFERPGVWPLAGYVLSILSRRHARRPDVRHRQAKHFRLTGAGNVPLQIDGDPAAPLPADIEVLPGALALFVP